MFNGPAFTVDMCLRSRTAQKELKLLRCVLLSVMKVELISVFSGFR